CECHHALLLTVEGKATSRSPFLYALDGRRLLPNMHLHVDFPAWRTPRRILSPTLVGRLSSHRNHTCVRCERGCRVVPRTPRTRMNSSTPGQKTRRFGKSVQLNPIFRLKR